MPSAYRTSLTMCTSPLHALLAVTSSFKFPINPPTSPRDVTAGARKAARRPRGDHSSRSQGTASNRISSDPPELGQNRRSRFIDHRRRNQLRDRSRPLHPREMVRLGASYRRRAQTRWSVGLDFPLLTARLIRGYEQCCCGCRKNGIIQRRFYTEGNCHGCSKQDQQCCGSKRYPHPPDSNDQGDPEEELRYCRGPRQERNRRWRHEGVHLGGIADKSCKISVTNFAPVKAEAVSDPGEKGCAERNARIESRPSSPARSYRHKGSRRCLTP